MSRAAERQVKQLEKLARRINFFDRFRRPISILLAVLGSTLIMWWVTGWRPADWPGAHLIAIGTALSVVLWYGIETFFGFLLALWETDYASLTRPATLPRAEVVRRK